MHWNLEYTRTSCWSSQILYALFIYFSNMIVNPLSVCLMTIVGIPSLVLNSIFSLWCAKRINLYNDSPNVHSRWLAKQMFYMQHKFNLQINWLFLSSCHYLLLYYNLWKHYSGRNLFFHKHGAVIYPFFNSTYLKRV